jgi:ParB family chromosome partitioning protein
MSDARQGQDKSGSRKPLSVERLLRTYRDAAEKKRAMVRKADVTKCRLMFAVEALRSLFNDDHFVTLLRAEAVSKKTKWTSSQAREACVGRS